MFFAIGFPIASFFSGFENSPYIAIVIFGLLSSVIWGDENFNYTLEILEGVWVFAQVFLFVTIGAVLIINKLSPSVIPYSFIVFGGAMIIKMLAAFIMSSG